MPVWRKLGLAFRPEGQGGWINSHAQVPTALALEDRFRVFISARPRPGLSLTGFVDLDAQDPLRVIGFSPRPVLDVGPAGGFDEHGVMPSSIVTSGEELRLYYSGWSRLAGGAPYHNTTGLAVSNDRGVSFRRAVPGPVLDRAPFEPFSATSPCVVREGEVWHAFYSSGVGWLEVGGKREHVYDIRHATSGDGITWQRPQEAAIPQRSPQEALTRPSILREADGLWSMWFCHRGSQDFRDGADAYRLGHARSPDLWRWSRDDSQAGLTPSREGWDSAMIAYPCVIEAFGRRWMFYNGNRFGEDGFGVAVWEP